MRDFLETRVLFRNDNLQVLEAATVVDLDEADVLLVTGLLGPAGDTDGRVNQLLVTLPNARNSNPPSVRHGGDCLLWDRIVPV